VDGFLLIGTRAAAADRRIDAVEAKLERLIETLEKLVPELAPSTPASKDSREE